MILMDGKAYRDELLEVYKETIEREKLIIRLDIILVGENQASEVYVHNKEKYARFVGIEVVTHRLSEQISEEELLALIDSLNEDERVTGIILQSPIPDQMDFDRCANRISKGKDVDGFTTENIYALYQNKAILIPCTVKGIIALLNKYGIGISGKKVAILGRGGIVGRPLALALTNLDATVTLCHSKTKNLCEITKVADIVISAVGKKGLVTKDMVKDGFVGIDVGINRDESNKLVGDFDFEGLCEKASFITPVPGGVGPMTVAMIIDNLIIAKKKER